MRIRTRVGKTDRNKRDMETLEEGNYYININDGRMGGWADGNERGRGGGGKVQSVGDDFVV